MCDNNMTAMKNDPTPRAVRLLYAHGFDRAAPAATAGCVVIPVQRQTHTGAVYEERDTVRIADLSAWLEREARA